MQYAKITDGAIEFAPQNKESICNYNKNIDLMTSDGFKLFEPVERPITNRYYHISYTETEDKIQEIIVYEETQEETDNRILQAEKQERIEQLTRQMSEIDLKRIRAICEPEVKDETTGETWLDYYNAQVLNLRQQIQELKERTEENGITN